MSCSVPLTSQTDLGMKGAQELVCHQILFWKM